MGIREDQLNDINSFNANLLHGVYHSKFPRTDNSCNIINFSRQGSSYLLEDQKKDTGFFQRRVKNHWFDFQVRE